MASALAEAAWLEADAALAEALACCDELREGGASSRDALLTLLEQALARAARKRGLMRRGALGAEEIYDPQHHEFAASFVRTPKKVRIVARGVSRGDETLVKARVGRVRRSRRS